MILQIYRDAILPGQEANFRLIEEDAARICAELKCPHPHLAMESLSGPKEVWWLNSYMSESDKERVVAAYLSNEPLMTALNDFLKRKVGVVSEPVEVFARFRADLSDSTEWNVAGARFFSVTVTARTPNVPGAVFEGPDGTLFVFRAARTLAQTSVAADNESDLTTVFAVRPYWGMPAREWIAADPEFWQQNPVAAARGAS